MRLSTVFITLVSLLPEAVNAYFEPKETVVADLFKPIMARARGPEETELAVKEEIRRVVPQMCAPWLQFFATAGKLHGLLASCVILDWRFWEPFLGKLPKEGQALPELIIDLTMNGVVKTYGMLYQNHKYLSALSKDELVKVITSLVCQIADAGEKSSKTVNNAAMHAINLHYAALSMKEKMQKAMHVHELRNGRIPYALSLFDKPWNEVLDLMYSDSRHTVDPSIRQKWIEAYTRFVRKCDAGSVRNIPEPEVLPLLSAKALDDLANQCDMLENVMAAKVISFLHRAEKTFRRMAQFWTNDSDLGRFAAIAMISIEGLDEFGPDIYHLDAGAMVEAFMATEPYKRLSDGLLQSPSLRKPFIDMVLRVKGLSHLQVPANIVKFNSLRIFIANNIDSEPVTEIIKSPSMTVKVDEEKNTVKVISTLKSSALTDEDVVSIGQKRPCELNYDFGQKYFKVDAAKKIPGQSASEGEKVNKQKAESSTATDSAISKSPSGIKNKPSVSRPRKHQVLKGILKRPARPQPNPPAEEGVIDEQSSKVLGEETLIISPGIMSKKPIGFVENKSPNK